MSDRELDALVAEKVMSLQVLGTVLCERDPEDGSWDAPYEETGRGTPHPIYLKPNYCGCQFKQVGEADYSGHSAACVSVIPFYSSSIEAVMQVVEKMRTNYAWDIESWSTPAFTGWEVKLWKSGDIVGEDRSESLPLAICRAALEAVKSDVKEQSETQAK